MALFTRRRQREPTRKRQQQPTLSTEVHRGSLRLEIRLGRACLTEKVFCVFVPIRLQDTRDTAGG